MTRDEVRELIAESLEVLIEVDVTTKTDVLAEAVLAAFAARGLIVGEPLTYASMTDEEFSGMDGVIDGDPDTFEGTLELFAEFGMVLVRVVPNE